MTNARASPEVGDPAPWFSGTAGADPSPVILDELAGRPTLLFFFGSAIRPDIAAALSSLDPRGEIFDGKRACFLGVSNDPDDFKLRRLALRAGQIYLLDSTSVAAAHYGVADATSPTTAGAVRATAFLLSPALQILDIAPFDTPEAFVQWSRSRLVELIANAPADENAPVLVVPHVFYGALRRRLVDLFEADGGREVGLIENNGQVVERADRAFRRRLDYYISDPDVTQRCRRMLERRLLPLVYRAFQFPTTRIERYLVGCYDSAEGGYFRPHRDNTAPPVAHRRFAVSIILNDGYEGGRLRFPEFGDRTYTAEPGGAIVFSCSLLHELTAVTSGRRFAFLTFLYDEPSQRIFDAYAQKHS